MNLFKSGLLLAAIISLTGCAHITPVTDGETKEFCDFKRYELNLDHRNGVDSTDTELESLSKVLQDGFFGNGISPIPRDNMLFISGGSLNGAFGAGVLDGWSQTRGCPPVSLTNNEIEPGCLPKFSVVTGVSTGAILSLAAFTNIPEAAIDGYTIEDESEAITAFVSRDENGEIGLSSYITALRKGALADLTPLQGSIYKSAATYDLFERIAIGANDGRKLLAGVVDVDTGKAVALDMTLMAKRIHDYNPNFEFKDYDTLNELRKEEADLALLVDCFTRGIAASSSVPLAARPIAIDNRLYIDGGARFSIFSDIIGHVIEPGMSMESIMAKKELAPINVYMLINGDQKIKPKCAKLDCKEMLESKNYWATAGARESWNVLELVERTVDILQTQVGEFSESEIRFRIIDHILKSYGIDYDDLLIAGMESSLSSDTQAINRASQRETVQRDYLTQFTEILEKNSVKKHFTDDERELVREALLKSFKNYRLHSKKITDKTLEFKYDDKTCTQWRKEDEKTDRHLQFHVNYMKCMIQSGINAITEQGWDNRKTSSAVPL